MSKTKFLSDVLAAGIVAAMGIRLFEVGDISSIPVTVSVLILSFALLLRD